MSQVNKVKETINEIKNIIKVLESKNINSLSEREDYFWKNHPDIMNNSPFLVSQLCSGEDNSMLDFMLKKLEEKEKSNKSDKTIDMEVGQEIVDKFIKNKE